MLQLCMQPPRTQSAARRRRKVNPSFAIQTRNKLPAANLIRKANKTAKTLDAPACQPGGKRKIGTGAPPPSPRNGQHDGGHPDSWTAVTE